MSDELVPAEDLPDSQGIPQGAEVPPEDLPTDYTTAGQQAKTTYEGGMRGATLGASDIAETAPVPDPGGFVASGPAGTAAWLAKRLIGQVKPEDIAGRMKANPGESLAGQVVGGGTLVGMTGGAGALINPVTTGMGVTTGIAKVAATNAALAALGLGAEGAAFGASNAVSDYALGDPNLNAQKVLVDMGEGALFNVGAGGVLKGIESVAPISEGINKAIGGLKNFGINLVDKIPGQWFDKMATALRGVDRPAVIDRLTKTVQDVYDAHGKALDQAYNNWTNAGINPLKDIPFEQVQDHLTNLHSSMEEGIVAMRKNPDLYPTADVDEAQKIADTYGNKILKASETGDTQAAHKAAWEARQATGDLVTWGGHGPPGFKTMYENLGNTLKSPDIWGADAATQFAGLDASYAKSFEARKIFMQQLGQKFGSKVIASPSKMNGLFKDMSDPSNPLKVQALNNMFDAAEETAKLADNYTNADIFTKKIEAERAAHEETTKLATAIAPTKSKLGFFKKAAITGLANWAGVPIGGIRALETGFGIHSLLTNPYEVGTTLNRTFNTIGGIGRITNRVSKAIAAGAKSVFSDAPRGALGTGVISGRDYKDRVDRIQHLQQNPQAMLDHLEKSTSAMYEAAPNISSGIHNAMTAGVNFLAGKIPQPGPQFPLSQKFEPSQAQKDAFNHYFEVVDQPLSVLDSIKDGSLNNHQIEALQAVYPHLLTELRSQLVQHLDDGKDSDMPYSAQIALSKFLGMPLEGNMTPQAMMSNQAVFNPPPQPPAAGPAKKGGSKSTLGGLKELDMAKRSMTETQALNEEEPT